MWQALNWDMWFDGSHNVDQHDKPKDHTKPSDPLLPFHWSEDITDKWTSDRARDWRNCHYQYDDLKDMPPGLPTAEFKASLRQHITQLYPSTSAKVREMGFSLEGHTFNDYIINVVYDRYALNGRAYSILFYIGEPTKSYSLSKSDPNFVGAIYTFSAPLVSADGKRTCDNCGKQQAANVLSKAQIPLTLPLIRRAEKFSWGYSGIPAIDLGQLNPKTVERILEVGLKWYFVALGGNVVGAEKFPDTEIAVLHGTGKHAVGDHIMPRYGGYTRLPKATKGKSLGYLNEFGPNDLIADD